MMLRCFSVILLPKDAVPHDALTKELAACEDWIRLGEFYYLVLTTRRSEDIKNAFRANLLPTDNVFVAEVNLDHVQGWVPRTLIDWIVKSRERIKVSNVKVLPALGSSARPKLPPLKT